jgi:hypothetical protein
MYAVFLSIIWTTEIMYNIALIKVSRKNKVLNLMKYIIEVSGIVIVTLMLFDSNLYINDTGPIGFKIIFTIILTVNVIELLVKLVKQLIRNLNK